MKHTIGPVEASMSAGAYPVCICDHENWYKSWYVNVDGPSRASPKDDARFIAWCYNNAPVVEAAPELLAALEEMVALLPQAADFDPTSGLEAREAWPEAVEVWGNARATIAKAKGE